MAYGVNAPFGLRPLYSLTGGAWTEKLTEYKIQASADGATTYGTSLFTGDPVVFSPTAANSPNFGTVARYLPAFTDATPSTFSALPLLGTFQGCTYTDTSGTLRTLPYWVGGTPVYPGTVITCLVADDPNIVYDVQISTHINAAANAFVASPTFPDINAAGGAFIGGIGSNFALNIGGGTNFNTVQNAYTTATGTTYANNPTAGSTVTGQSAFYLDIDTSTAAGGNNHDYNKTTATLPVKVIGLTKEDVRNVAATGLTITTTPFLNVTVMINNHVFGHNTAGTTLA